jgi:hypothetical protein
VQHLAGWRGGAFLRAEDGEILARCHEESRMFLTYDMATIPDLLRQWAAQGWPHSGVIFADRNTVPPNSPGLVSAAVARVARDIGDRPTASLVLFLLPGRA